jgi:hypothetical protein
MVAASGDESMRPENIEYYRRRAEEERAKAAVCADRTAALAHRDLAVLYERLARGEAPPALFTERDDHRQTG